MSNIKISFKINGRPITLQTEHTKRLLDILRDDLELTGTKEGCGIGECGACTVVMDGKAVNACLVIAGQVDGAEIYTIEGMEKNKIGRALQEKFISEGAIQCGYCTPGMIMSSYALLANNTNPSKEEISSSLSGNLCRCTGYIPIIQAIKAAAECLKEEDES
jgi:carbon-monoxide dehydrogenase small subunit